MAGEYFNPPPNWPVPRDWTPPPSWEPDPSWPPAPPGWQFWVDHDPTEVDERPWAPRPSQLPRSMPPHRDPVEQEWPEPTPPKRNRTPLILGAVGVVMLLIAGTVGVVTWLRDDDAPAIPDQMLAGTYPSQPDFEWSAEVADFRSGEWDSIATPEYSLGPTTGAIVVGEHIIIRPWNTESSSGATTLMSVSLADGTVEWTTETGDMSRCSPRPLGDKLPCLEHATGSNESELNFIDLASGDVGSSMTLPFYASFVDSDGISVYTGGYDQDADGFTVAKGSADAPMSEWKTTVSSGQCEEYMLGDAWDFGVKHGLVWGFTGGGATAVLKASDGTPLFDHDVADVWVSDDSRVVSKRCERGADSDEWTTEVSDLDGELLFRTPNDLQQFQMRVFAGTPPALVSRSGAGLNPTTGDELWRIDVPDRRVYWPMLVGNVSMWQGEQGLTAYDMRTGQQLWNESTLMETRELQTFGALTDGERVLLPAVGGGVQAISVSDGSSAWSYGGDGNFVQGHPALYATSRGLLVVTRTSMRLLPPTGPPSPVPDTAGTTDGERDGNTELVTKCGRPPQFVTEAIRADSGSLVITMKIVAKCPGGDVLSGKRTRIAVTSDSGQNVASAIFDLSVKPIVIPPDSSGSSDEPSVSHEFHFPVGTFWRLPVSVDEIPSNGETQRGAVDLDASKLLVECEEEQSTADTGTVDTASKSSTATGADRPKTGDDESASFDALRAIANSDRPFVNRTLAGRWVPQLSSKRPGLVADGITWNNAETLREHLDLRLKYPEVRLLWTGEWSTFSEPNFWVTIAGVTFPDAEGALAWCRSHSLDRDHCYAKLVSTTHPVAGSTAYNR